MIIATPQKTVNIDDMEEQQKDHVEEPIEQENVEEQNVDIEQTDVESNVDDESTQMFDESKEESKEELKEESKEESKESTSKSIHSSPSTPSKTTKRRVILKNKGTPSKSPSTPKERRSSLVPRCAQSIPKMYTPPSKANESDLLVNPEKKAPKGFVPACAAKIPKQYQSPKAKAADESARASPVKRAPKGFVPACAAKIPKQYQSPKAKEESEVKQPVKRAPKGFVPSCAAKIPKQYQSPKAKAAEEAKDQGTPTKRAPKGFVPRVGQITPKKTPTKEATDEEGSSTPTKRAPKGFVPRVGQITPKKTPTKEVSKDDESPVGTPTKRAPKGFVPRVASITPKKSPAPAKEKSPSPQPKKPTARSSPGFFDRLASSSTAARRSALKADEKKPASTPSPKRVSGVASSGTFDRLSSTPTKALEARRAKDSPATPKGQATKPRKPRSEGPSIFDRLTDTSLYTGSHKERFTPDGKGRGKAGRSGPKGDFYESFREDVHKPSTAQRKEIKLTQSEYKPAPIFDRLTDPKLYTGAHKERFTEDGKGKGLKGRDRPKGDVYDSFREDVHKPSTAKRKEIKLTQSEYKPAPIFDRLTDPKLYTGAHKERFDEEGKGKGLKGRDRPKGEAIESFREDVHKPSTAQRKEIKLKQSEYKPAPIFDRLTDPKLYTGAHKERFDEEGKGKGLKGRDQPKGDAIESFREDVHKPSTAQRKEIKLTQSEYKPAPIFDRLTDPKNFTGAQKKKAEETEQKKVEETTIAVESSDASVNEAVVTTEVLDDADPVKQAIDAETAGNIPPAASDDLLTF